MWKRGQPILCITLINVLTAQFAREL